MVNAIAIIVLAGGRATRLGGGDKPLRLLDARPILSHVLERVTAPGIPVALNANGDPGRFAEFGLPVIADAMADYPGPLAGILAGLDWASGIPGIVDVLSVPGDCPFIPRDLVAGLDFARTESRQPLACAKSGGYTHPVIGLWPVSIREELREALALGERKIDRFTGRFGCASAEWSIGQYDPFFNVNTPEELEEARRWGRLAT